MGLVYDRRWMIVDADGQFITALDQPKLLLVKVGLITAAKGEEKFSSNNPYAAVTLTLDAPNMPTLQLKPEDLSQGG